MLLLQLIPFIVWFIVMGAGVALYVIGSLGTYTVAKHRGLKHAWLVWISNGNSYICRALSDDVTALCNICSDRNRRTGGFDCAVYPDTVYGAVYFSGRRRDDCVMRVCLDCIVPDLSGILSARDVAGVRCLRRHFRTARYLFVCHPQ